MLRDIQGDAFQAEVLRRGGRQVVLFWAQWCPFCVRFKRLFDARASETEADLVGVDISSYSDPLWDEYAVDVVPTLVVFDDGEPVDRRDGVLGVGLAPESLDELLAA